MLNLRDLGPEFFAVKQSNGCCVFEFDTDADIWKASDVPVDDDEWLRAKRLLNPVIRDRFIATRRALRQLLGSVLELDYAEIRYEFDRGKPDLAHGLKQRLRFNLSHSGNVALVALHETRSIGIDVELRLRLPNLLAMSHFVLTARESEWIIEHTLDARDDAFLRLWTLKEAALKATGSGFFVSPRRLELPLQQLSRPFDMTAQGPEGRLHRIELSTFDSCRYFAAVAIL